SLGIWQIERLQWKNALIEDIKEAQAKPALGTLPQDLNGLDYRNVVLTGSFIHDKTLRMAGAREGEGSGFFLLTPFRLEDDGRIILVNRGFAPPDKESRPQGVQTITGIIRPARVKRLFSLQNHPEKNLWFYEDIPAMSEATGLALTPVVVEAVGPAQPGVYPIPGDGKIRLRNDHLGYAVTWFSLAIIAMVMFGMYYRKA
ncbi:MAG: SURF1 family protein, partial [Pseudomonadota bacterium]|nr:SURF1 family protein [Pseudomonadota bacterium]